MNCRKIRKMNCRKIRENKNSGFRTASIIAFALYGALMIWLLFGQRAGQVLSADITSIGDYFARVGQNIVPLPLVTTADYAGHLFSGESGRIRAAIINLGGNIAMFLPLGFLLPCVFRKISTAVRCLLCTLAIIASVELVQLFTLLGVCDADDLLFNTIGSMCGYALFRGFARLTVSFNEKSADNMKN